MKNLLLFFILISSITGCQSAVDSTIKDGDIIFHESLSSQGAELKLSTKSQYTHMGIIYKMNGSYYVYEAVQPVKLTALEKWINRGKDGHYVIKRLRNADKVLTETNLKKMKSVGKQFRGRSYDNLFQWSDTRIYCSELVWKIYKRALNIEIGSLQRFKDFDLSHPRVKALIQKRYGNRINLNETVISPVQMFNSDLLVTVQKKD